MTRAAGKTFGLGCVVLCLVWFSLGELVATRRLKKGVHILKHILDCKASVFGGLAALTDGSHSGVEGSNPHGVKSL